MWYRTEENERQPSERDYCDATASPWTTGRLSEEEELLWSGMHPRDDDLTRFQIPETPLMESPTQELLNEDTFAKFSVSGKNPEVEDEEREEMLNFLTKDSPWPISDSVNNAENPSQCFPGQNPGKRLREELPEFGKPKKLTASQSSVSYYCNEDKIPVLSNLKKSHSTSAAMAKNWNPSAETGDKRSWANNSAADFAASDFPPTHSVRNFDNLFDSVSGNLPTGRESGNDCTSQQANKESSDQLLQCLASLQPAAYSEPRSLLSFLASEFPNLQKIASVKPLDKAKSHSADSPQRRTGWQGLSPMQFGKRPPFPQPEKRPKLLSSLSLNNVTSSENRGQGMLKGSLSLSQQLQLKRSSAEFL